MLQAERVGQGQEEVGDSRRTERDGEKEAAGKARHREDGGEDGSEAGIDLAGGDGTEALGRVEAVALGIGDIVDEIDGRGEKAEEDEAEGSTEPVGRGVAPVEGEHQAGEEKEVLDPLL